MKNPLPPLVWRLLFAAALVTVVLLTKAKACDCHQGQVLAYAAPLPAPQGDSWIFAPSQFTHDPDTGARVAQYAQKVPVEPLPDQRAVTSGYVRKRTVLQGPNGSNATYYQVQNYGNARGGMDAEWERFHDAWRGSTIGGGQFGAVPGFGFGFGGFGGFGGPGVGFPGGGFPGYGGGRGRGYGQFTQPGVPDPRLLDPDGADGFYDQRRRTPDRRFFGPNFKLPGEKKGHRRDKEDKGDT